VPFSLGVKLKIDRDMGGWHLQSLTVGRRPHEQRELYWYQVTAEVVNRSQRQAFPRVRVMLYREGQYLASCFAPPSTQPFVEVNPGYARTLTGRVALPRASVPDALLYDTVPEIRSYTLQVGGSVAESITQRKPIWTLILNGQLRVEHTDRVPRGAVFESEDHQRFVRLPNGEVFLESTLPPERLDHDALKQAREQAKKPLVR
jgi:hypothetical protein